ncbi:MAG: sulfite exporter TauE/SafE family protein [Lachnospiraceae bacterium]|nr:sulfite exporter TauE/SafE family protein [Lachnospiraceae bacterium]
MMDNEIASEVIRIDGMTCINCQNKIEKKLINAAGIQQVHVDYRQSKAEVDYDPTALSLGQIHGMIRELGYEVINGDSKQGARRIKNAITVATIILLYYLLQHFSLLNYLVPSKLADSKMSYGMLFVVGLLTSVHCIAMCGGINLSQSMPTKTMADGTSLHRRESSASLMYNLGRVISYTCIGAVLGAVGMVITGGNTGGIPLLLQGILKIAAGIFMVIMGINTLGWFKGFWGLGIGLPKKLTARIMSKRLTEKRPLFVGMLNGFMPCGPMQSMQIIALGSGNPFYGGAAMFMFSMGTVPLMLGLGSIVTFLGKKYTKTVMRFSGILVIVLGMAMFTQGAGLAGINLHIIGSSSQNVELDTYVLSEDGTTQYVESNLDFGNYPRITVRRGVPVKWVIHVQEEVINGCNYKMNIKSYGITHVFEPGDNVIEFVPDTVGTVQYTCWMGMIYGEIEIVE